jgi:hypothetical protein
MVLAVWAPAAEADSKAVVPESLEVRPSAVELVGRRDIARL